MAYLGQLIVAYACMGEHWLWVSTGIASKNDIHWSDIVIVCSGVHNQECFLVGPNALMP